MKQESLLFKIIKCEDVSRITYPSMYMFENGFSERAILFIFISCFLIIVSIVTLLKRKNCAKISLLEDELNKYLSHDNIRKSHMKKLD